MISFVSDFPFPISSRLADLSVAAVNRNETLIIHRSISKVSF
jgi:hypothetical protein